MPLETETTVYVELEPGRSWLKFIFTKVIDNTIPDIHPKICYRTEIPRLNEVVAAARRIHEGVPCLPG